MSCMVPLVQDLGLTVRVLLMTDLARLAGHRSEPRQQVLVAAPQA